MTAKGTPRKPRAPRAPAKVDLGALGATVLTVFGTRTSRVLIEMPAAEAESLFAQPLAASGRTDPVDAVERDIAAIRERDPALAESALAAAALAMAYELQNPYNSATSKSMCARALVDAIDRLRELAPPAEQKGPLDDIRARLAADDRGAAPADLPGPAG